MFRQTLDLQRKVLGPAYENLGRRGEAEALTRELLEIGIRVLGPGHYDMLGARVNLAILAADGGRRSDALAYLRAPVDLGFSYPTEMMQESAFKTLSGLPEFERMMARARENALWQVRESR